MTSPVERHRRKKPIFIDEPIQWHLDNARHDRCPYCGMDDIGYVGTRSRTCLNESCGSTMEINLSPKKWLIKKMANHVTQYWHGPDIAAGTAHTQLRHEAQRDSRDRRAVLELSNGALVFWHADSFQPETAGGEPVCAPGSKLWDRLNMARSIWRPATQLHPLEILAREAPEEDVASLPVT